MRLILADCLRRIAAVIMPDKARVKELFDELQHVINTADNRLKASGFKYNLDKMVPKSVRILSSSESLKVHEILRFKNKMTEEQIQRLQKKILSDDTSTSRFNAITALLGHGIKLIPELKSYYVFSLAYGGNTAFLTNPEFREVLKEKNDDGDTPLHLLAAELCTEIFKSEFKDILKIQNNRGDTPLHIYVWECDTRPDAIEILKPELMELLKIQNKDGSTPLHILAEAHHTEIIKPQYSDILKIKDKQGKTPEDILSLIERPDRLPYWEAKRSIMGHQVQWKV